MLGGQFLLVAVTVMIAIRVRRLDDSRSRFRARTLALVATSVLVGHFIYLNLVLIAEGEVLGPVVLGRALPWLALQVLALVVCGVTVVLAVSPRGLEMDGSTRALMMTTGGAFAVWAAHWGLLLP